MISVEQALARITAAFRPLPVETVSLGEALGRVLAEDVEARVSQPPQTVSAMDGYAVRTADLEATPVTLTQIGEAPAGGAYAGTLQPGETVRIFTGGPLPDGADAIVIQEDVDAEDGRITVRQAVAPGTYVRPAGLDFRAGDVGIEAGRLLTARDIGLAAAMNVPWLRVRRRPRIAILSTGDELVMPGEPLGPHQLIGSNGVSLAGFVTACGGEPINLGIARDSRDSLAALAESARGADLLVTSGGASVGKHDLVREVLGERGLALDFWKIAMRPGKPLMFGHLGEIPLLGLPGNPVSTVVCAVLFLGPVIDVMLGHALAERPRETARLGAPLGANDRRQDYLRAHLSYDTGGGRVATPFERQDSSMFATLAHADCLIVRPPHAPAIEAGEAVEIVPFPTGVLTV
jgi:molybdopterin molybdotransferase